MGPKSGENWRKAKKILDSTTLADQARSLRYEMSKQGISVAEAVPKIVRGFCPSGSKILEDQVRALATSWAPLLELSEDRFVELWFDSLRRD